MCWGIHSSSSSIYCTFGPAALWSLSGIFACRLTAFFVCNITPFCRHLVHSAAPRLQVTHIMIRTNPGQWLPVLRLPRTGAGQLSPRRLAVAARARACLRTDRRRPRARASTPTAEREGESAGFMLLCRCQNPHTVIKSKRHKGLSRKPAQRQNFSVSKIWFLCLEDV